jgi:hypothetical protein
MILSSIGAPDPGQRAAGSVTNVGDRLGTPPRGMFDRGKIRAQYSRNFHV